MRDKKVYRGERGYRVFRVCNSVFFALVLVVTAYPIYYVVIASFSNPEGLAANYGAILLPIKPYTLDAYRKILQNPAILSGYLNTLFILVVGLVFNLSLTAIGGYFLAQENVLFRRPIAMLILFTMYFSGGMVPSYLNIKSLGLMDSLWALILPGAISTYNMLIMRSAFATVPSSLVEAAHLDGASHLRILCHVMLPLTGATMAVMVLYYGVAHWNSWFAASIYLKDSSKVPLALILRQILIQNKDAEMMVDMGGSQDFRELIKYALIVVSTLPIMVLYPFLQRFFVKGVMVGAVKG